MQTSFHPQASHAESTFQHHLPPLIDLPYLIPPPSIHPPWFSPPRYTTWAVRNHRILSRSSVSTDINNVVAWRMVTFSPVLIPTYVFIGHEITISFHFLSSPEQVRNAHSEKCSSVCSGKAGGWGSWRCGAGASYMSVRPARWIQACQWLILHINGVALG